MSELDILKRLGNFNLIHYTSWWVLTIDRGMGGPIIYQADTLEKVLSKYTEVYAPTPERKD